MLGRLSLTPNDSEEHYNVLSIDDIRAILALKKTKQYSNFDTSEEAIFTEMIKLCINMLNYSTMRPEKEVIGYFTCKKLKNLKKWEEWKAGEKKKIDQFTIQGMF